MKPNPLSIAALVALAMSAAASHAATVLYSENFDGEGTAGDAYNDGTTPEINVGGIGVLAATGISQGGNATDTAWLVNSPGTGERGLRFGGGYNWATGANAATILAAGGFSVSFDYNVTVGEFSWACVRVGSGAENSAVNAGDVTFGALARANGQMQTFENGAGDSFGAAGPVGLHSAQFFYAFNSWEAGTTVTFTGILDGNTIATDTFTWDATNDMKIVFSADNVPGTTIDNIVVSTIPEPSAALLGGLGMLALLRRRRA